MQEQTQDSLAMHLSSLGIPPYGNLSSLQEDDRLRTMECIESLLRGRQKDAQGRELMNEQLLSLEQEKRALLRELDAARDKIDCLKGDVGRAENAIRVNSNKWKAEKDKLTSEKDELRKDLAKLSGSRDQLIHEIKKRDGQISKLQDQARKNLGDCSQVKSAIEVVSPIPPAPSTAADYATMYRRNYEEMVGKLAEENENYRSGFVALMSGLTERVRRAQSNPQASAEILEFKLPAAKSTPREAAEAALRFLDLSMGIAEKDESEDTENEDEGVTTLKEARKKLSILHIETYRQLFRQQERVLQAVQTEREALAVLEGSTVTPEFQALASAAIAAKKPESAAWRAFAASYVA